MMVAHFGFVKIPGINVNHSKRYTKRDRYIDTEIHTDTETQRHRETETERHRDRDRDRETQRQKDTETQRQKDHVRRHRET